MFVWLILGVVSAAELLLYLRPLWSGRQLVAGGILLAVVISTGLVVLQELTPGGLLIAIFGLYRVINLGRVVKNRMQADYLYQVARRTSWWLVSLGGLTLGLVQLSQYMSVPALQWWYVLAAAQFVGAAILLASTRRHLRTTRPLPPTGHIAEQDLPSLTVAIPARNETVDLEACLESLIASNYPKLEILVLDDCSQNQRTPEIIRGFAHDGVRFIAGSPPPGQWLAKNHAYAQLATEANGALLLFCGVDSRFQPDSLTNLVTTLLQKRKSMISLVPRNTPPRPGSLLAAVAQPNRYAWELALPRRLLRRPPVLSTCWLITREALQAAGGFAAVSRSGAPESYLARTTASHEDGYSFLQADQAIGVSSQKAYPEQRATAIRTRYLQLHRRPELVALVGLAELLLVLGSLAIAIGAVATQHWSLAALAGLSYLILAILYSQVVDLTYRQFLWRGTWLLPLAGIYDAGLLNYSMWQYEFREVIWKGRNVCIPVMRVVPRLPRN